MGIAMYSDKRKEFYCLLEALQLHLPLLIERSWMFSSLICIVRRTDGRQDTLTESAAADAPILKDSSERDKTLYCDQPVGGLECLANSIGSNSAASSRVPFLSREGEAKCFSIYRCALSFLAPCMVMVLLSKLF
jgi:hypothetical protein